jgi:alginate O-acetyltransferase complex protein AlgI
MHTVAVGHPGKGTRPFRGRAWRAAMLGCVFATMLMVPLGIRVANAARGVKAPVSIYLPAYEASREREPFNPDPISDLARLQPGYVVIGDSMAGRIDASRLGQLSGRPVAPLLQAGSGSAYWYLALKNWVVASGIRPRAVFVFFRDTNLTDALFRLSPWSLDHVALEREDELNHVVAMRAGTAAHRLELAVEHVYQGELARQWAEPAVLQWPARVLIASRRQRLEFINGMNARFDLDHQRKSDTIDVYRGELRARRSLLDVAVFISFFPHLVAGPIQRASFLLPQVEATREFSFEKARTGFLLICWGLFKKLVIADNVGIIANKVFALADPSFWLVWSGVFAFAIQIYADFSAYTDIARGTSRWLGFELTENFDHPYLARSPADFWRRWNISLSTWFRDYVYIPLGGSRVPGWVWARNVLATFLLSGLWHGASWNYVLWGFYHGVLLIATRAGGTPRPQDRAVATWRTMASIAVMFLLTTIGWLLFRETSLDAIARDLTLSPLGGSALDRQTAAYLFILAFLYSVPLWVQSVWVEVHRARSGEPQPSVVTGSPWPALALQGAACGLALTAILVLRSRTALDFIYFQF